MHSLWSSDQRRGDCSAWSGGTVTTVSSVTGSAAPGRALAASVRRQSGIDARTFDPDGRLARTVFEATLRRMEMARERRFVDYRG